MSWRVGLGSLSHAWRKREEGGLSRFDGRTQPWGVGRGNEDPLERRVDVVAEVERNKEEGRRMADDGGGSV